MKMGIQRNPRTDTGPIRIKRPMLLNLLVIALALLGAFLTVFGLYWIIESYRNNSSNMLESLARLLAFVTFVSGAFELVLVYGLWKLKLWAWWLGVIVHILLAVLAAAYIFRMSGLPEPVRYIVVLLVLSAVCLLLPEVRQAFNPTPQTTVGKIPTK
jgi:uncharacterized membrane protein